MEEPFLQHICSDDLKTREDEVSEFINCVLGAFSNPVDSDCWNRVCGALQALEDCSSRKELRGRRDLLHYLNRLSVFLLSEGKQVQRREELLQILQPLMDSVSIRQGSLEIPPSSNALASMDILTSDNYNPLEQNAEFKFSLLSTHGKHKGGAQLNFFIMIFYVEKPIVEHQKNTNQNRKTHTRIHLLILTSKCKNQVMCC